MNLDVQDLEKINMEGRRNDMLDKKTIESITKDDIQQLSMEQLKWAYSRYLSISRKTRRDTWSPERKDEYYKKQYKQRRAREKN